MLKLDWMFNAIYRWNFDFRESKIDIFDFFEGNNNKIMIRMLILNVFTNKQATYFCKYLFFSNIISI